MAMSVVNPNPQGFETFLNIPVLKLLPGLSFDPDPVPVLFDLV
jgi:hypothetical protein